MLFAKLLHDFFSGSYDLLLAHFGDLLDIFFIDGLVSDSDLIYSLQLTFGSIYSLVILFLYSLLFVDFERLWEFLLLSWGDNSFFVTRLSLG